MATLGTQDISTSYVQLIKTSGLTGIDGTIQAITDGNNTSSALQLSTLGVSSTGTLNSVGATTLASSLAVSGAVTLSSSLGVTGAATLSSSLGVTGAATLSSSLNVTGAATLSSSLAVTGVATFSTNINASNGTATIGAISSNKATISTATVSTAIISTGIISAATISTATIPIILGATTFASTITASTGTNTLGTIASTTIANSGLVTVGTLEIGGTAGPRITRVSYGTAPFTLSTVTAHNFPDATTGTFELTGAALGDIVTGSIDSLGSTTGTTQIVTNFFPISSDTVRYVVSSKGSTAGTIPAGTIYATAMRFIA